MKNRRDMINNWIKEVEKEIEEAIKNENLQRKLDMQDLKAKLIKIRDGTN